jgi:hypothetical protein
VTKNIPAECTSCDDCVSLTENVFATKTENEGMLPIIQRGLICFIIFKKYYIKF